MGIAAELRESFLSFNTSWVGVCTSECLLQIASLQGVCSIFLLVNRSKKERTRQGDWWMFSVGRLKTSIANSKRKGELEISLKSCVDCPHLGQPRSSQLYHFWANLIQWDGPFKTILSSYPSVLLLTVQNQKLFPEMKKVKYWYAQSVYTGNKMSNSMRKDYPRDFRIERKTNNVLTFWAFSSNGRLLYMHTYSIFPRYVNILTWAKWGKDIFARMGQVF